MNDVIRSPLIGLLTHLSWPKGAKHVGGGIYPRESSLRKVLELKPA